MATTVTLGASSPADAAQRSKCQSLRGADLAPAGHVKLVARPNRARGPHGGRGVDLVGCVLPRGALHVISRTKAATDIHESAFDYVLRNVAGRIVLLDTRGTERGLNFVATTVWDLSTGASYRVAHTCGDRYMGYHAECIPSTLAYLAFVTRSGRAVVANLRVDLVTQTATIESFAPDGRRNVLDAGTTAELSPASLSLTGTVASWIHSGEPRSASIWIGP